MENGHKVLGAGIEDISRNKSRRDGSECLDYCQCALRLVCQVKPRPNARREGQTSVKFSKAGTARSRIGYNIRSGSMRLIHFKQLDTLLTVLESSENIDSSATVRKHCTSSRLICFVKRRC